MAVSASPISAFGLSPSAAAISAGTVIDGRRASARAGMPNAGAATSAAPLTSRAVTPSFGECQDDLQRVAAVRAPGSANGLGILGQRGFQLDNLCHAIGNLLPGRILAGGRFQGVLVPDHHERQAGMLVERQEHPDSGSIGVLNLVNDEAVELEAAPISDMCDEPADMLAAPRRRIERSAGLFDDVSLRSRASRDFKGPDASVFAVQQPPDRGRFADARPTSNANSAFRHGSELDGILDLPRNRGGCEAVGWGRGDDFEAHRCLFLLRPASTAAPASNCC